MTTVRRPQRLTDCKWLNLFEVPFATSDGKEGHWTFASRKHCPQPGTGPLVADAVVIIPLIEDGEETKLVVLKEFRVPLGDYEFAFPAGLFEKGESAEVVARRELKEETGLTLTKVLYVGPAVASSAGMTDETVVYVACQCEGQISGDGNDVTEDITVELMGLARIKALRRSANKMSSKTLPFLLMFEALGKIAWPEHLTD